MAFYIVFFLIIGIVLFIAYMLYFKNKQKRELMHTSSGERENNIINDKPTTRLVETEISTNQYPVQEPSLDELIDKFNTLNLNDQWPQRKAAEALGNSGNAKAIPPLVEALGCNKQWLRKIASEALLQLKWNPENDRQKALFLIGLSKWDEVAEMGKSAVEPLVVALLENSNVLARGLPSRIYAACALEKIADVSSVPFLVRAFKAAKIDEYFEMATSRALERIGLDYIENTKDRNEIASAAKLETSSEWDERLLREALGQPIDIGIGWEGLPWNLTPDKCKGNDFVSIQPGTYVVNRVEYICGQPWVYVSQGSSKYGIHGDDIIKTLRHN